MYISKCSAVGCSLVCEANTQLATRKYLFVVCSIYIYTCLQGVQRGQGGAERSFSSGGAAAVALRYCVRSVSSLYILLYSGV